MPAAQSPRAPGQSAASPRRRAPSRTRRSRCPGSRRCCCPAGSGPISSPPSSIGTPRLSTSVAEHRARLPGPEIQDRGILRRSFGAAVPGPVVVGAVGVGVAVGFVVLAVVRNQVPKREAVVGGDEVDRGVGPSIARAVEVGRTGQAGRQLRQRAVRAAPEIADGVPVAAVPLAPQGREAAHVVAVRLADVPWFGDELDPRDHRILSDEVEERRQAVELAVVDGRERRQDRTGSRPRASRSSSSAANPSSAEARLGCPRWASCRSRWCRSRSADRRAPGGSRPRCRGRGTRASARGDCLRPCG